MIERTIRNVIAEVGASRETVRVDLETAPIPADWEDVTAEWMTTAIRSRHPDATVRDVVLLLRDDGTNRRARFALTYDRGSGPTAVFVKAEADAHRQLHARNGNLFNEASLFASGVSLPVDHPLVFLAVLDRPGLDYVIVMEDLALRGADPRDATRPLSLRQVANGMGSLAKLHGQYWDFTAATHPELDWVQTWEPTDGFQIGLRQRVPVGIERAGTALPAAVMRLDSDQIVDHWARFVRTLTGGGVTLLHGDAHIGNTYVLPSDEVGFLDWQVVRRGNWSQDIGYFLVGALTEKDRRAQEDQLLEDYLGALTIRGEKRVPFADARLRYRASAAYGLAIWLSTLGSDGFQSQEVSLALAKRYATAFVELSSLDALADLGV
jgi:hypothetical protein